jgi:hypothetical protein
MSLSDPNQRPHRLGHASKISERRKGHGAKVKGKERKIMNERQSKMRQQESQRCEVCGNVYDKSFEIHRGGEVHLCLSSSRPGAHVLIWFAPWSWHETDGVFIVARTVRNNGISNSDRVESARPMRWNEVIRSRSRGIIMDDPTAAACAQGYRHAGLRSATVSHSDRDINPALGEAS